ncbi:unnamed protein product [Symbiodinium microadriaticum]|nr:unnamed protein product [Symbiodinium sp. KB8]CAE7600537.1 unnamed protein product [Symbiodinium microadriaticum]
MDACRDVRQDVAQRQTLHEWIGSIRRHFSFAVSSAMADAEELPSLKDLLEEISTARETARVQWRQNLRKSRQVPGAWADANALPRQRTNWRFDPASFKDELRAVAKRFRLPLRRGPSRKPLEAPNMKIRSPREIAPFIPLLEPHLNEWDASRAALPQRRFPLMGLGRYLGGDVGTCRLRRC